jgi:hypothetical protein
MIRNALYLWSSQALDGVDGGANGVLVLRDGTMRGGNSVLLLRWQLQLLRRRQVER